MSARYPNRHGDQNRADQLAAYRQAYGVGALAELLAPLDTAKDLTDREKAIIRYCRATFGEYAPGSRRQAATIRALLGETPALAA